MDTGLNPTQLARRSFFRWLKGMDESGIVFFRHKLNPDRLLERIEAKWNGGTGMVYLKEPFDERRYPHHRWRVCYTNLEPLNAMEVLALAADA
jgi:hypothetical protein